MARKRTAAGVALVVALTVGGCSVSPGAAAVVEGRPISQSELEETHADFRRLVPEADAGQVLVAMIVAPLFIDAAADNGVGVSAQQAAAFIQERAAATGGDPSAEYSDGVLEIIQFSLAAQNLQSLPEGGEILTDVATSVEEMDIDINPRYGELDTASGSIVPLARPWIVQGAENA